MTSSKLVNRSVDWLWSSLAIRCKADKPVTLSGGPVALPRRWKTLVDGFADEPTEPIETCLQRGRPFGDEKWIVKMAKELALQSSLNPRGRPKKNGIKEKGV